ncbi:hypothetical protein [Virgibacillus siamensis]|uniref:hypothetical protein n=1 Tax=Virgibacillus siamensis TaxID=480071 RepID=UPI0009858182|nr:hypothetical protein [Virgibacillus siamensis]
MLYIGIVIVIYVIPFIWFAWSMIDVRKGKRQKVNWKGPLLLFAVISVGSIIINFYLSSAYNLAFFQNSTGSIIGLIVVGLIVGIMAIINFFATLYARRNNLSKTFHNPRVVWIITGVIGGTLLIFFLWFMPLGQKVTYAVTLNNAINMMEESPKNKDFSIVLMRSTSDCLGTRCIDEQFDNVFYIRNNMDQKKEVQVKLHVQNGDKEKLKVINSNIMELEPGELKMVKTKETSEHRDIWSQSTFTTEERVVYYKYNYRYRDVE